jgi:hypothetical protein
MDVTGLLKAKGHVTKAKRMVTYILQLEKLNTIGIVNMEVGTLAGYY